MKVQDLRKIYMNPEPSQEEIDIVKAINLKGTETNYRTMVKRIIKREKYLQQEGINVSK